MTKLVCGLLCLVIVASESPAWGQSPTYYDFYPKTVLTLGRGFDPTKLDVPKQPCVVFKEKPLDRGALTTVSEISLVQSMNELRTALHLDMEAEAQFLSFKGSSHYSVDASYTFVQTNATLVLYFATEFPRMGVESAVLTPAAQALIDAKNYADFATTCGTEMVLIERRGASVAVVLTIQNVDTGVKAKLRTVLSAGADLKFISGSAKAELTAEIDSASREGRLNFRLVASGGEGFGELGDVLSSLRGSTSDVLAQMSKALEKYLSTFKDANAAPLGFHVGPMLGHTQKYGDLWGDEKRYRLLSLVDNYRRYNAIRDDVTKLLAGGDPRDELLVPKQKDQLRALLASTSKFMATVATIHGRCKIATQDNEAACTLGVSGPAVPSFYKPIVEVNYRPAIVTDREILPRTKSHLALSTPGVNLSLLERAQAVVPTAKTAWHSYVFESPFLIDLDLQLLGPDGHLLFWRKIFRGGKSNGNAYLARSDGGLILAVRERPADDLPLAADLDMNELAAEFVSLIVKLKLASETKATLVAKSRDLLGQTRTFDLATFEYRKDNDGVVVVNRFLGTYSVYYQRDPQR